MRLDGIVYTLAAGDAEVCLTVITSIVAATGSSFALRVQFRAGDRDNSTIYGSVTTSVSVGMVVTHLRIPYVAARPGIGRIAAFVAPSDRISWAARIMSDNVQGLINITESAATDGCDADDTATLGPLTTQPTGTGDVGTSATATAALPPPSTVTTTASNAPTLAAIATPPTHIGGAGGASTAAPFRTTPTSGGGTVNMVPGNAGDSSPAGDGSDSNSPETIVAIVVIGVAVLILAAVFAVQRARRLRGKKVRLDMVQELGGSVGTAAAPPGRLAGTNATLHSWLDDTRSSGGTRHTSPESVYETRRLPGVSAAQSPGLYAEMSPRLYAEIDEVPEYQIASGAEGMEVSPLSAADRQRAGDSETIPVGIDADGMIRPVNPPNSHDVQQRSLRGTLEPVLQPPWATDEMPPTPPTRMSLIRGRAHDSAQSARGGPAEPLDEAYEPVVRESGYEPVDKSRARAGRRVTKRLQASSGLDPDYDVGGPLGTVGYDTASPAPEYEIPSPFPASTAQTPTLLNAMTGYAVTRSRTDPRKGYPNVEYVNQVVIS